MFQKQIQKPARERKTAPFPRRRGLTLIETLGAVLIVALLAALLFPIMAKNLEKARETECIQRMRQLGMAFHSYAGDNDQKLPVQTISGIKSMTDADTWTGQLYPYTETYRIMACPSSPRATFKRIPNTYGYNGNVALIGGDREGGANHNPLGLDAVRMTMSKQPTKDVLLIDHYSTSSGNATVDGSAQTPVIASSPPAFFPHPRPGKNQSNVPPTATRTVLYVSGNVALLRPVASDQIITKHWEWPPR